MDKQGKDLTTSDRLARNGAVCAELLLPGDDWIRRRVEAISFVDRRLVRRKVSIDFAVPEIDIDSSELLVPISIIEKWPPLLNFDLRSRTGKPLPLLTTTENACMDEALLLAIAGRLSDADSDLPKQLHRLTHGDYEEAVDAFDRISGYLGCVDSANGTRDRLLSLTTTLCDSSILWVPVDTRAGRRTIVKFAYDAPSEELIEAGWERAISALTGRRNRWYALPHLGHGGSYHLEVRVPDVVTVKAADLLIPGRSAASGESEPEPPGWAQDAHSRTADRLAHLYIGRRRRELSAGFLVLHTAIARTGALWTAWATSVVVTLLLGFYWHWADKIVTVNSAAITTLLLVPTVLGYLIVRPNEHPLTREHLAISRILVLASGALPILAVLALVAAGRHPAVGAVDYLWRDLAFAGLIITMLLTVILCAASSTKPSENQ
jgi:hypothetical protein